MTEMEDAIRRIKTFLQLTHIKSLTVTMPRHKAKLVFSMLVSWYLKEQDTGGKIDACKHEQVSR